ncbi:GNAT family N-acetyltransferase [Paenibacillus sp. BAC0078]
MKIEPQQFTRNGLSYTIRSAVPADAQELSEVRLQIDGETENLDRVRGEGYIDAEGFEQLIQRDTANDRNLFLVAVVNDRIAGFSRCEGNSLQRLAHKVEFGIGVLQEYWGYGIGNNLLQTSIAWADSSGIRKMSLYVLEINSSAINLYRKLGFEVEGVLLKDKLLSDGSYYNTVVMGRWSE